jgi:hypothetical protein
MRTVEGMDTSTILRKLIRACVDDECTLRHESSFVDPARAHAIAELVREREQFIEELERFGLQGTRRPTGSWTELLSEAGRNVWVVAAGRNNTDAIATCEHSRARTERRYEDAMQEALPDPIRDVLEAHFTRLHQEADELNQLRF